MGTHQAGRESGPAIQPLHEEHSGAGASGPGSEKLLQTSDPAQAVF